MVGFQRQMQYVDDIRYRRRRRSGAQFIDDFAFTLGKGEEGFSIDGEKEEATLERVLVHVGHVRVEERARVESRQTDGSPRFC